MWSQSRNSSSDLVSQTRDPLWTSVKYIFKYHVKVILFHEKEVFFWKILHHFRIIILYIILYPYNFLFWSILHIIHINTRFFNIVSANILHFYHIKFHGKDNWYYSFDSGSLPSFSSLLSSNNPSGHLAPAPHPHLWTYHFCSCSGLWPVLWLFISVRSHIHCVISFHCCLG